MCVRRMWSVHPADRRLLAATQQEVRTPDDVSPGEVAPVYLSLRLTVAPVNCRPMNCRRLTVVRLSVVR